MDPLLRQLGYSEGTVASRYAQLDAALQPKEVDPRPQILEDNEKWVRDAERRARDLFDLRPKARVEVRREPAFSEAAAGHPVTVSAADGSSQGVFWLPLPGRRTKSCGDVRSAITRRYPAITSRMRCSRR